MTNLFNPIAILREGVIYLEAYTEEKPFKFHTASGVESNGKTIFENKIEKWQDSKICVPFKDQDHARRELLMPFTNKLISTLKDILHRIEIVDNNAIIKPEQEEESQGDILYYLLKMHSEHGLKRTLKHFKITRK